MGQQGSLPFAHCSCCSAAISPARPPQISHISFQAMHHAHACILDKPHADRMLLLMVLVGSSGRLFWHRQEVLRAGSPIFVH